MTATMDLHNPSLAILSQSPAQIQCLQKARQPAASLEISPDAGVC